MMTQEFCAKSGIKVRAIEAEASGGLIEIDLKAIKQTADGTYLIPSKDLQAAGRWALTIDVAQLKKEGKEVPPEMAKDMDKSSLVMHELMQHLPTVIKSIMDLKNSRVHPIERGIEKALSDTVSELTREVLAEDEDLRESIKGSIEEYFDKAFGGDEEEGEGAGDEKEEV